MLVFFKTLSYPSIPHFFFPKSFNAWFHFYCHWILGFLGLPLESQTSQSFEEDWLLKQHYSGILLYHFVQVTKVTHPRIVILYMCIFIFILFVLHVYVDWGYICHNDSVNHDTWMLIYYIQNVNHDTGMLIYYIQSYKHKGSHK